MNRDQALLGYTHCRQGVYCSLALNEGSIAILVSACGLVERHVDVEGRVEVLQKRVLRIFVGEVGVFGWNAPVDA